MLFEIWEREPMNILDDIQTTMCEQDKAVKARVAKEASDYDVFLKTLHSLYQQLLPLHLGTATVERQGWGDCEGAGEIYYTTCVLHVVLQERKDGFFCCDDSLSIEYRSGWNLFGPVKTINISQSLLENDKLECFGLDAWTPPKTYSFNQEQIYQFVIKELIRDKFKKA